MSDSKEKQRSIMAWMQHADGTRDYASPKLLESMLEILDDETEIELNYDVECRDDGWYFSLKARSEWSDVIKSGE